MKRLLYIIVVVPMSFACHYTIKHSEGTYESTNTKSEAEILRYSIPDSNQFNFKRIREPLPIEDANLIKNLKDLTQKQYDSWLKPIANKQLMITEPGSFNKMVSFQRRAPNYYSIVLMRVFELSEDFVSADQFLVNVDNKGKFIDGKVVYQYIPGESLGDSISSNGLILNIKVVSHLEGDTIKEYSTINYLDPPDSHDNNDVKIDTIETAFIIDERGKILRLKK